MTNRLWIKLTLGTILLVSITVSAIGYVIDPYGLMRDPTGRRLSVYFEERKAKFLMSKRYVPANFDGVLLGPSSADNWDLRTVAGVRMYNESLSGGNAREERLLLNEAATHKHFRLAILVLAPTMTHDHEVNEGLENINPSEAIISIHAMIHEFDYLRLAIHGSLGKIDAAPNGQYQFIFPKKLETLQLGPDYFAIDPVAAEQYRSLVDFLQEQCTVVVYLLPPLYEPFYKLNKMGFDAYAKTILSYLPPAPIINMQAPEYIGLRSDPDNFIDWYHLQPVGAVKAVALLNQAMPRSIATSCESKDQAVLP